MAALTQAVKQLKGEQARLESELERVNKALAALNGFGGRRGRQGSPANGRRKPRRRMSAAGRRRIAAAQRARWAKLNSKRN